MKKGIFFALLTAVISGISIFYSKITVTRIDPLILTTSRNLYAGIIFGSMMFLPRNFKKIKSLKKDDLLKLFSISIIGGSISFALFFTGLKAANPQVTNLIHKTMFVWVSIMAAFFLKEKFNLNYFISGILIVVANALFLTKISFGRAEMLILMATLLWSTENIIAKKLLKKNSSEVLGFFRMGIGSIFLILIAISMGKGSLFFHFDIIQLTMVFIGGSLLFFYVYFWFKALKYSPAGLVTMILTLSVAVGNVLNGSFAGVKLLNSDIYSSALIIAAVGFILYSVIPNIFSVMLNLIQHLSGSIDSRSSLE